MEENKCRQCLLRDLISREEYEKTVERVRRSLNAQLRTPDEEYEARLSVCRACDQLQNGTCMLCGCLAEMRAMRKDMHCPPPRRRW